jgi:hypothetical protein
VFASDGKILQIFTTTWSNLTAQGSPSTGLMVMVAIHQVTVGGLMPSHRTETGGLPY